MTEKHSPLPICCVTGRIAGDPDACGDCDPCGAADRVPQVVKDLIKERMEWADRYGDAVIELEEVRAANGLPEAIAALESVIEWFDSPKDERGSRTLARFAAARAALTKLKG